MEVALQVLCVTMENESGPGITSLDGSNTGSVLEEVCINCMHSLFQLFILGYYFYSFL